MTDYASDLYDGTHVQTSHETMDRQLQHRPQLARLLRPKRVAVLGGRWADEVVRQCVDIGFDGELWRIHERARDLPDGVTQFQSLAELPAAPDATFLAVSADATVALVAELRSAGAGGAVCFAAGFAESANAESDIDGINGRQLALEDAAGLMPVLGPNCYGYLNYVDGVALWPDQQPSVRVDTGVALITQSGNLGVNLTFQQRDLPVAYLISAGNQAVVGLADLIHAMLDDRRVTAIGLYIEGVGDGDVLRGAVERAREARVPIVVIKAGRTASAISAAAGHTASIAGDDAVFDAFCARFGLARVASMSELVETLKFLHVHGPLAGAHTASMSCSGGEAVMASDLGEPLGLEFSPLPQASHRRLSALLGDRVHLTNPLDYHTYIWGDEVAMTECYAAVLDASYDAVALLLDFPNSARYDLRAWEPAPNAFIAAVESARRQRTDSIAPVVIANLPESMPSTLRVRLLAAGIAPLQGLPDGLAAIAHAARIGRAWFNLEQETGGLTAQAEAHPLPTNLDEFQLKQWLRQYGVPVPQGQLATTADASEVAASIGLPVAIKTTASVAHKSDVGGVSLGLSVLGDVRAAAASMRDLGPQVLVEAMQQDVVTELLVTVRRDPVFGRTLIIGPGGVFVELLARVEVELFPVSAGHVEAALRRLPIWPLLEGYRGKSAADVARVVAAICAICDAAESLGDDLIELEINPLLVTADDACAVDALLTLKRQT